MTHTSSISQVTCPCCGNRVKLTTHLTPHDTDVEGPPVHWFADACKQSGEVLERKYTLNKEEVTCLLCKIKCRCAEKQNGS